jgi:hypothetical protein
MTRLFGWCLDGDHQPPDGGPGAGDCPGRIGGPDGITCPYSCHTPDVVKSED